MLACMLIAANRSVLASYIASIFFERLDMVKLTGVICTGTPVRPSTSRKLWMKIHFFLSLCCGSTSGIQFQYDLLTSCRVTREQKM